MADDVDAFVESLQKALKRYLANTVKNNQRASIVEMHPLIHLAGCTGSLFSAPWWFA